MEKKTIISKEELEGYENAKYEVTTVVFHINNPVKIVKTFFNLERLIVFLKGFSEFAEFVVKVERVELRKKKIKRGLFPIGKGNCR